MLKMAAQPHINGIERRSARCTSRAAAVSAGLSIWFVIVYGGCNWIASRRTDVGSLYFEWERRIPFVSFFALPYLSIDLFFIAAPFLLATSRELKIFSLRVVVAIAAAGICFLLFPFRFAFSRPPLDGISGMLLNWFLKLDPPYNLVPSLHAAFWLLLVNVYWRHTRGIVRLVVMSWLVLIGLSPILTYQHHVIDIVTGLALGGLCLGLIRGRFSSPQKSGAPNNPACSR